MTSPVHDMIAIHGAGSIGCYVGARLAVHAPVRYIGRESMLQHLREHGLTVSDYQGHRYRFDGHALNLYTDPLSVADTSLVLVCVKSAATVEAARELAAVLQPGAL